MSIVCTISESSAAPSQHLSDIAESRTYANWPQAEFIAVYSLPHVFASARIAVHLFLRITEKFELEHPHGQSCADEG